MDDQVNPLERDHSLSVVLPGGLEKNTTVHGSKPVMDLLVTLCASYHLNPSDYTVEFLSPNKNNITFKPNSPIGSLEAEKIVLKPKGVEEKIRRPYMPEASVRLLINYNKSHKAVVRVSPRVPLEMLLPVVCDKCEFNVETTVLLRDAQSNELLDLSKTLNEHGLREVFAKDTAAGEPVDQPKTPEAAVTPTEVISPPPPQDLPKQEKKQKENTGFLSLFRRGKKKAKMEGAVSTPTSPGHNKQVGVCVNGQDVSSSNSPPADMPKKRRAPQPPMGASQSVPSNLSACHLRGPQRSAESTLRSTKRRAPPPPCANPHQELQADTEVKGSVDSLNIVEELRESDDSDSINLSPSSSSSPYPSQPQSSSSSSRPSLAHLHEIADPYLPSFRGKDFSDARSALAKVLTSSVSKGTLVKRLRNSATFTKFNKGSSLMSQRCSDNGVFCADPESVLTSNLPTESQWEDPLQRKGTTTFKVVPSKMQKFHDPELTQDDPELTQDDPELTQDDPELTQDIPDQITVEDKPESEGPPELGKTETEEVSYSLTNQTDTEEDPCSPTNQTDTEEDPCSPTNQTDTEEDPCSPTNQTDTEEVSYSLTNQTETEEDPCSPTNQTETEEDPCSPTNQTDTEEVSYSLTNQTETEEDPCSPTNQTDTDEDPCSLTNQTETEEVSYSLTNQTDTEEDPCSPTNQTDTDEDPCSLTNQTDTDEDPCSLTNQTNTDEDPCSLTDQTETEEVSYSLTNQTDTDEDPCSLTNQTDTDEDPCSLTNQTDTDKDPCSLTDQTETEEVSYSLTNQTDTEEDPCPPDRSESEAPSPIPEPSPQAIQASDQPASPPPPLDLDDQDCPDSPLSEVGDTERKEEDGPEVTLEVVAAAPSDCSEVELPSDAQINSEDQSELLQSPSRQSVSVDMDHCGSDEREVEEEVTQEEKEEEEDSFPPPPSPVFFNEDIDVIEDRSASSLPPSQPPSPTSNGQTSAFSEDHQNEPTSATPHQSAAAPKPLDKMSSAPSRFAQAVALAVQRSRLQRSGKGLGPQAPSRPHSTLPSPPRSIYQYGA